jgi:hypothetical protein
VGASVGLVVDVGVGVAAPAAALDGVVPVGECDPGGALAADWVQPATTSAAASTMPIRIRVNMVTNLLFGMRRDATVAPPSRRLRAESCTVVRCQPPYGALFS